MRAFVILSGLALSTTAMAGEATFNFNGSCPGPIDVSLSGMTPGGSVAIVSGTTDGATATPGGPCAGTMLGLGGNVKLRRTVTADATGSFTLSINAPGGVCGAKAQAIDLSTCEVTGVRTLTGALTLVGSYDVNTGPGWAYNPVPVDCREACADIFGGSASSYVCSTDAAGATAGQSFVSGWGDGTYCNTGISDDYSKGDYYDCGAEFCSYSAYVQDWCYNGTSINYCWQ